MSLVLSVRAELNARKGEWPAICKRTGLSYWWLIKYAQGRIDNPGVLKLEKLMEHFESNPREHTEAA
ncbi:hypothetical protein [Paraburkholderia unamae]|uniref:YdaS antitoxin of YdaST toxin-antitoxin system n=1 Tax=Paraburkholderia unamae TaxID=219649 RepID=A0ABX5KIF9_9BURK|nr:hypothetical protein [Paraburkholderia unamae]PVX77194.1 hypothetical protein C7402_115253 [Paraburkholderia unamae]